MTELEWRTERDPIVLLRELGSKTAARLLRLIACACCRLVWDDLVEEAQQAVVILERFADGLVSVEEVDTAVGRANEVVATYRTGTRAYIAALVLRNAGTLGKFDAHHAALAVESAVETLGLSVSRSSGRYEIDPAELASAADAISTIIRDVTGRCFWRGRIGKAHRMDTQRQLALAAYDERHCSRGKIDEARLGVLSDALEEAGCTDTVLLAHLRAPGPHMRGCWAVDAVLGLK